MMIIELDAFCDTYIAFLVVRGKSLWMSRMRRGGFKKSTQIDFNLKNVIFKYECNFASKARISG